MMKTKKQTKKLSNAIQQEINWSRKHKSQNPNGNDWMRGFIDGLSQAKNIVVKSETMSEI